MKQYKYQFIILYFIFFGSLGVFAQKKPLVNPSEWLERISEHTSKTLSLHSAFKQEKVLSFLQAAVVSEGEFWFLQPAHIRWEYQKPYSYVMIMNQGMLTVKDEGDEYSTDLSANKMFEQMNGLIAGSIQGKLLEEEKSYQKEYFEDDDHIIVRFLPLSNDLSAYLTHIEIFFDKENLDVNQLIMMESGGDYTKIEFYNKLVNQEIAEDVFE